MCNFKDDQILGQVGEDSALPHGLPPGPVVVKINWILGRKKRDVTVS